MGYIDDIGCRMRWKNTKPSEKESQGKGLRDSDEDPACIFVRNGEVCDARIEFH
jgi:hypothetical protein